LQVRIPLANDVLDVWDWLLGGLAVEAGDAVGRDMLESGSALRVSSHLNDRDQATVWFDEKTGLPASFRLRSADWGELLVTARSVDLFEDDSPGLFSFEDFPGVELVEPEKVGQIQSHE
jgi:hypothetical protein